MKKHFKAKKRIKSKRIYLIIIFLILVSFIKYISSLKIYSNVKYLNTILTFSNLNINYYEYLDNILYNLNDIFNKPKTILSNELKYKSNEKHKPTNITFQYIENENPIIYIYNSHQNEKYKNEYLEEYNIVPDVIMASKMLKDKLEKININTIVEENDILAYMKENGLDHSGSYIASRYFLSNIINKYNSIKLYIDLHRDAAKKNATTVIINGKECAKVLFVIGLENKNYQENLNITEKINNIINNKYPGLTRGIMKKKGYGVNGIYNQDLKSNIILLEVGGNENNIEEVNNTLDLIANVIGEYINEKE